ncbi:hypothetical protein LIT25_20375 [Bacillus sp. F19]|nr:hypothetical protein LIT25_20375 [Bacillus sp. F19]
MTKNNRPNIEFDGGQEQDQKLQKSKKQGRKRRNEPKNAVESNEQS